MIIIRILRFVVSTILIFSLLFCMAYADVRVYVNGIRLEENVIMHNDRTYIPLRAVSESLGANVMWDENSNSAYVTFTEEDAVAKAVENVSPSVVTIVGNYDDGSSTVKYNNPTVHGSGVVYKSNGYIITNAHVVEDIKNLTVILNDGTLMPGSVLYSDEKSDLAIVKINKIGLSPVTMAHKDSVISGKTALAIGTPISLSMRNTVTQGIVCGSDVSLPDSYYKLIQTDAAVNPGNSGGPLINSRGELIGIVSSKYVSVGIDNVAFAIPVDTVQYAISQFENYGYIRRPVINLELEESWEAKIGLPTTKGITVKKSSNTLLINGDVINSVNGIEVHSVSDWNEAVKDTYNGISLWINYTRDGIAYDVEINV